MAIRGVWILTLPTKDPPQTLFSRKYPTVELRAKILNGHAYVSIPSDEELKTQLLEELGILYPSDEFIKSRDTCFKSFQKPIFEIKTSSGELWPLVLIEKYGLLFCCLPLVEDEERPPLTNILGLSLGFSLLLALTEVLGPLPAGVSKTHPKFLDLYKFLSQAAPFGRVIDINPSTVFATIDGKVDAAQTKNKLRAPYWRPYSPKVKNAITFKVTEQIQAVLYNRPHLADVLQVYGTVSCKADLDMPVPQVAVRLNMTKEQPLIQNVIVHPCVQSADIENRLTGEKVRNITFIPPASQQFVLCMYTAAFAPTQMFNRSASFDESFSPRSRTNSISSISSSSSTFSTLSQISSSPLPVAANFEMTGSQREVSITVRARLLGGKNNMEYCEVQIPFYNRGHITHIDVKPSVGEVIMTSDRRKIGWNIGQKFPSKGREAVLEAKIKFVEWNPEQKSGYEDPFCKGLNSYALIYFKFPDYTHTGVFIDPKSVQVQPSAKPKVSTTKEFLAASYKIWNSKGDVLSSEMPEVHDW